MAVSATALVLARGGSKSLPRKNLRLLAGVPLIEWVVTAARSAETTRGHVVVSTDDPEIAACAKGSGALIVERPEDLAGDHVEDLPVLRHALRALGMGQGVVVHLRATSPFVSPDDIDRAVRMLVEHRSLTSLRSVRRAREHPRKMYREASELHAALDGAPTLTPYTGERHAANSPRQSLEPVWLAAGFIDVLRAEVILGRDGPEGSVIGRWVAPEDRAVDINTEADWAIAERRATERGWAPRALR